MITFIYLKRLKIKKIEVPYNHKILQIIIGLIFFTSMSSSSQEQLFLIISRLNLNPNMIPPFKIILPTLQLLGPIRLFSSMQKQIKLLSDSASNISFNSMYESLVHHLQNEEGEVDLNETMNLIYNQKMQEESLQRQKNPEKKSSVWNFRICVLGEEIISWDIVMKFKLKNVLIDTIGENKRLQQISFATGGINKSPTQNPNITKLFMTIYSLSTECRRKFSFLSLSKDEQSSSQSIQFTVDCVCCKTQSKQLRNQCYLCSRCLGIHCSIMPESCSECEAVFENIELRHKPC